MKKLLFAFLLLAVPFSWAALPTDNDLSAMTYRFNFYVQSGYKSTEIPTMMSNYFGKHFEGQCNAGTMSTNIQIVYGSGNEIYYMQTIGTMKGCD